MKIALDATPIGVRTSDKGGVYRYISQLIAALQDIAPQHEFRLLFNFCKSEHVAAFEEARAKYASRGFEIVRGRIPAALWMRGWVPAELVAGRVDVFHGLYDFVPPVARGAAVVTIHDLRYVSMDGASEPEVRRLILDSPQLQADYRQRVDFFRRQRQIIGRVARRASRIITASEFSRRSIVDALGVPEERIAIVPHGVSEELRLPLPPQVIAEVLQRHAIARPYLLFVGDVDPRENRETLVRAVVTIRRSSDVQLVLAGPSGWYGEVLRQRVEELGLADDVMFLGHVREDDLKALYYGASLMVFPSLFEGFGLPVLEAMACGTPVVCSNHCSLPEVAADAAVLVDPTSESALASAVLEVLADDSLQDRLRRAGLARSREFSWRDTARRTLQVYECAAENRNGR